MRVMLDPLELSGYFNNDGTQKLDDAGEPLLDSFSKLFDKAIEYPYNHMTHVDKMFSLTPLKLGVLTAGIASLGNRTVNSLIAEFKSSDILFSRATEPANYTVRSVSTKLVQFIRPYYNKYISCKKCFPSNPRVDCCRLQQTKSNTGHY